MKKLLNVFVLGMIVILVGYKLMGSDLFSKDFSASCVPSYNVETNEMSALCNVEDPDSIISSEHPLKLQLLDSDGLVLEEKLLTSGSNQINFTTLQYNSEFSLILNGYELIDDVYTTKQFFEDSFSTVFEDFEIPVITSSNIVTTDINTSFDINLVDVQDTMVSLSIKAMNGDVVAKELTYTNFDNLSIVLDSLTQLKTYSVIITGTYSINDYEDFVSELGQFEITTLKTPEIPDATINIISNDNVTLEVGIDVDNKDATSVSYSIALINDLDVVIQSTPLLTNTVSFDISEITTNYRIAILSSYDLSGTYHTDTEISAYIITTNVHSNFFTIPGLEIVDTSQPLSNYNEYEDYVYTHFNAGDSEFRIDCSAAVDCTSLVQDEPYASVPFQVIAMVHSFYVTKNINYSFTSSYIDITVEYVYTPAQIIAVENEIDSIINSIITVGMTENEKITAIHDFVVNTSVYDTVCFDDDATCDNDHSAYGVLFDNNAVCEGYSHTIDILLRAVRIPSIRISSETHQWNGVYFNDEWVHLDATWDDPVTSNGTDLLVYDYYLIYSSTLASNDDSGNHTYDSTYVNFIE